MSSETILDFRPPESRPPLELVAAPSSRSPVLALLLSLIFPGLGHFYIGLPRNGIVIIAFESLALLVSYVASGSTHAGSIFAIPVLYCYAMADAYFGARERNAGATLLIAGTNPRIVAVLNLLTKGFGYFYLGDRAKGIICFLVISGLQALLLLHLNIWTSILAISFQVAIALDGYRITRERLFASYPELAETRDPTQDLIARANPGGLPPAIATGFFVSVGIAFLIGYGILRALTGHFITQGGNLDQGPSGLIYRNPSEHLSVAVPNDWTTNRTEQSLIMLQGKGVNIILLDEYSMYAAKSHLQADRKEILKAHPDASFADGTMVLADHVAETLGVVFTSESGAEIHQRLICMRRGIKLIFLIESWTKDEQRGSLDEIERSLTL